MFQKKELFVIDLTLENAITVTPRSTFSGGKKDFDLPVQEKIRKAVIPQDDRNSERDHIHPSMPIQPESFIKKDSLAKQQENLSLPRNNRTKNPCSSFADNPEVSAYAGSLNATPSPKSSAQFECSPSASSSHNSKMTYMKENFSYIKNMIQKNAIYPKIARHFGWEGKVTVSFVILSNGSVKEMKIQQSSGRELLDQSALEAVRNTSPFPVPPAEAQILIPIVYSLH
ncbi:MAG: energy transducer TonB [Nitrospirota bacterium]